MRTVASGFAISVVLVACSSEPGHTPARVTIPPGSSAEAGVDASIATYDGTVGDPCSTDEDCRGPHGPGVNRCSNGAFLDGPLLPTAVCVRPSCDPGSDGNVHRCDGPDAPTSPGVCFDTGGGAGVCLPACTFAADGSAPRGCVGKDACNFYGEGTAPSGSSYGVGYCFGGCAVSSDCPNGSSCQSDTGLCVKTARAPVLPLGNGCNPSAADPGCNCFGTPADGGGVGYCTQSCITGSATATCPSGMVCDPGEPAIAAGDAGFGGGLGGFGTVTPGLAGSCLYKCAIAAEGGGDGGTAESGAADAPSSNADDSEAGNDAAALDATASDAGADAASGGDAADGDDGGGDSDTADGGSGYPPCPAAAVCSTSNVGGPDCAPVAR